jgi:hypothetical protein
MNHLQLLVPDQRGSALPAETAVQAGKLIG